MLSINTNLSAQIASAAATASQSAAGVAMERLSSGARLNSAKDDAANVAISSRLHSEATGLNMAVKNAMDARSLLSVVDGAYVEVEKNLQRYREIFIYAKNDTLSESDRNALFEEAKQLARENERIHETTTWGSQSVFAQDNSTVVSFSSQIVFGVPVVLENSQNSTKFEFLVGPSAEAENRVSIDILNLRDRVFSGSGTIIDSTRVDSTMSLIDAGLTNLSEDRAKVGSFLNRIDHTISNLTLTSVNIQAAKGRIEDTDFATESTVLARQMILQQASTAMLAQANASKQNVLSLLQG
jgi:flagellin